MTECHWKITQDKSNKLTINLIEDTTIITKEDLELAKKFAEEKNIPIINGLTVADKKQDEPRNINR